MNSKALKTLEEMAKLEVKATPGPWVRWKGHAYVYQGPVMKNTPGTLMGGGGELLECSDTDFKCPKANAEFIAASRLFVPWAIARIRELEAVATESDGYERAIADVAKWVANNAEVIGQQTAEVTAHMIERRIWETE